MDAGRQLDEDALRSWRNSGQALPRPVIVAVGLALPVNAGMILRIADAVNARQVYFVDAQNPDSRKMRREMRRASRMMTDTDLYQFLPLAAFLPLVPTLGALVALEITTRSRNIYRVELPEQIALVVGGERHGIPPQVLDLCQQAVHIPMMGRLSSMNVAVSLAVGLYEWVRQRHHAPNQ
jgi:tRNA G18 (ribose-2'-O)-methylase SpoU